jgi:hypothetical protein
MSAIYREFPLRAPSAWTALVAFIKANAQACLDRGHTLRVIVTEDEKKRNSEQNRRYWGYILKTISDQAWVNGRQFDKDVWHEWFARKFGVCEDITLPNGEIIVRRKSTTDMTIGEFSEYMNLVESDAAHDFGVIFE